MSSEVNAHIRPLLERYYTAQATPDAELEALVAIVRASLTQRLVEKRVYGEDLEDLCSEALGRLVTATRKSREPGEPRIGNYLGYALTVADSVFEDHVRQTRPNWFRLKRRIVYLLDGKGGGNLFARWRQRLDWLGGFIQWRGRPFRSTATYRAFASRPDLFRQTALCNRNPEQIPLPELLALLLRWLATPLTVDELTTQIASLQQIGEPVTLSLEAMTQAGQIDRHLFLHAEVAPVADQVIEGLCDERFRMQLSQILRELPLQQRHALLLSMDRHELLLIGTGTQLADLLEIPLDELAPLWPSLPLPDRTLAARMNRTPKQVANLRKCARERLARWLAKIET